MNPFSVVRDFESELCEYTGSKYAVTTTSCTTAIFLALSWFKYNYLEGVIKMPKYSYVGVAQSILRAGFKVEFVDLDWEGEYQLDPFPVWDSARRFTSNMFRPGNMQTVSFHWGKILGLSQGGAILHDNKEADVYFRKMRFDGRTEGKPASEDLVELPGIHAYMSPEVAAHGIMKLSLLPMHNKDLPKDNYPDLSLCPAFL